MMLTRDRLERCVVWLAIPVIAIAVTGAAGGADRLENAPVPPAQEATDAAQNYWLGLLVAPADAPLKSHLQIDAGVVVEQIVPKSPAAEAGIEVHDILLKFGDSELADVDSLQKAVGRNQDREAQVTLLRAGQERTLTVKPEERPADAGPAAPSRPGDWGRISEMLKRLERGEFGEDPLRMFFVQPGFVVPKEFSQRRADLFTSPPGTLRVPQGTRITVMRQHEGPATVTVEKDGQKWEVTEDELDRLPEDVRPAVKGMLGGGRVYVFGHSPVVVPGDRPGATGRDRTPQEDKRPEAALEPADKHRKDVQDQLEQMHRLLRENEKQMKKQMDELRQQLEKLGRQKT